MIFSLKKFTSQSSSLGRAIKLKQKNLTILLQILHIYFCQGKMLKKRKRKRKRKKLRFNLVIKIKPENLLHYLQIKEVKIKFNSNKTYRFCKKAINNTRMKEKKEKNSRFEKLSIDGNFCLME